jgi:putative transcriptional regulator
MSSNRPSTTKKKTIIRFKEVKLEMPIKVNLDVMMAKRKIGLMELAEKINITPANLSILKNNKARAIRFSTLEEICKALSCQPADILEYEEDQDGKDLTE